MSKTILDGKKLRVFIAVLFGGILLTSAAWADSQKIISAIDAASSSCRTVSEKIFEWKELGQQEVKSSALLAEELRRLGFQVTRDLKVPEDLIKGAVAKTAFRAEMSGKGPGPTITMMLEYDALTNGHSCGHNLISTSGLLAAAGLARVMAETPGRLLVIGTPDEERGSLGGGKIGLLEGGHFAGSDVVLITHPGDEWSLDQRMLANKRTFFTFKGKSAHAAAAPHQGINALRAVIQTFNNVDMLREHLRQDVRIHGIITKGGDRVNVVPEVAQAEFSVRSLDTNVMEETFKKVVNCARAAELATGAKLEHKEPRVFVKAPISVEPLNDLVADRLKSLGVQKFKIRESFGSSDLGNVAHEYPTINISFKIAPAGTAGHSDAMREAADSLEGWKATVTTAKGVALSAYELLTNPGKVQEIQAKFKELKAREGK